MTTYAAVIAAAVPDANEDDCEFVLWNRTPYPMGRVTAKSLFRAASGWHRAASKGVILCDLCHRIAVPERWVCERCDTILTNARAEREPSDAPSPTRRQDAGRDDVTTPAGVAATLSNARHAK